MNRFAERRRRPSLFGRVVKSLLLLLVGGVAVFGALWGMGIITTEQVFAYFSEEPPQPGLNIPVAARPIAALSSVTQLDIADPEKGGIKHTTIGLQTLVGQTITYESESGGVLVGQVTQVGVTKQGETRDGAEIAYVVVNDTVVALDQITMFGKAFVRINDVLGRVAARDKPVGRGFQESDFLPEGTRTGIAGGTPEGMYAMTLRAGAIKGVHSLQAGDKIDLVGSIPLDQLAFFGGAPDSRLPGAAMVLNSQRTGGNRRDQRTEARVLANDAMIVSPVTIRQEPTTSASLTQGQTVRNIPVQEIVIALTPSDVPLFTDAIAQGVEITAVAHSGRPNGVPGPETPPDGTVAVPVVARPVPAYESITMDDLIDPKTRRERFVFLAEEEVQSAGVITEVAALVGRVVRQDTTPGKFFRDDDLFPAGSPTGIAAATPAGKMSMTLQAEHVTGAATLRRGDRIDLVCSIPIDLNKLGEVAATPNVALQQPTEVRRVATSAVVLAPVGASPSHFSWLQGVSSLGASMLPAEAVELLRDELADEFVIAVDPDEVAAISEALSREWTIRCVAHTGVGGEAAAVEKTPGSNPLENAQTIEVLVGGERRRVIYVPPAADSTPKPNSAAQSSQANVDSQVSKLDCGGDQ